MKYVMKVSKGMATLAIDQFVVTVAMVEGAIKVVSSMSYTNVREALPKYVRALAYRYGSAAIKYEQPQVPQATDYDYKRCVRKHSCHACVDSACTSRTQKAS